MPARRYAHKTTACVKLSQLGNTNSNTISHNTCFSFSASHVSGIANGVSWEAVIFLTHTNFISFSICQSTVRPNNSCPMCTAKKRLRFFSSTLLSTTACSHKVSIALSPSATQAPMNIIVKRTLKLPLLQWATYSRWSDPPPLFLFKNLLFLRTGPPHFWKGEKRRQKKKVYFRPRRDCDDDANFRGGARV